MFTQYFGTATVHLSDDRMANVSVMEDRSAGSDVRAFLSLSMYRETPCQWGSGICTSGYGSGYAQLSNEQIDFDRSLGRASVTDVPYLDTIVTYVVGPNGYTQVEETVTISVVLTGTGPVSRDAYRSNECPMGGECQVDPGRGLAGGRRRGHLRRRHRER